MPQNINLSPAVHLCPHSHTWYARGLLNLIGFLLLLIPFSWQIFLQTEDPGKFFLHPVILKIFITAAFLFIIEFIISLLTKQKIYADASFLFSTLILMLSLPAAIPLGTVLTAILFAYLTTKYLFNRKAVLTPFVCTAYAYAFFTQRELFAASSVIEFSPFIANFLKSHHLTSGTFSWLIDIQGQTFNTFTAGYACIAVVFYFLKITNFRISMGAFFTYMFFIICFSKFENLLKYPQTFFVLMLIAGDTSVSPFSNFGKWIYGSLIGLFTFLLQILWYPDAAGYFAVLMATLFVPGIDACLRPILLRKVKKTYEVLL